MAAKNALVGLASGMVIALVRSTLIAALLYGVGPRDPRRVRGNSRMLNGLRQGIISPRR